MMATMSSGQNPLAPNGISSPHIYHQNMQQQNVNMQNTQQMTYSPQTQNMGMTTTMSKSSDIGDREQSRTVVSSQVIDTSFLGEAPVQDAVKYVEVPVIEEVIRHVPVREVIEIEKRVPKVEVEYVERIIEVPRIEYVEKLVEVPQVHEVVRKVPRKEVVDRTYEVVRHIPKIETVVVEKQVEIPGQVIEVPKPYTIENKVNVPRFVDKEIQTIVAQTMRPTVVETNDHVDVDVTEYEPYVQVVDVHVTKGVNAHVVPVGMVDEFHQAVQIPPAQYNMYLKLLNPHIQERSQLPYLVENGTTPFAPDMSVITPQTTTIVGFNGSMQQVQQQHRSHGASHHMSHQMSHHMSHVSQRDMHASHVSGADVAVTRVDPVTGEVTITTERMTMPSEGNMAGASIVDRGVTDGTLHSSRRASKRSQGGQKKKSGCAC